MDRIERSKMVKAMEFIARQVNDEEVFEYWLSVGVADGDIDYGDLFADVDGYYIRDEEFSDLMNVFLHLMKSALKSGGLYCDGVISSEEIMKREKAEKKSVYGIQQEE